MAKKSKSKKTKKAKKKNKNKKKLWCTEDLDFDKDGNLRITNPFLAKALEKAIYRSDRRFKIRIDVPTDSDQPGVADRLDDKQRKKGSGTGNYAVDDDGGRPPVDAMCPC